ncbi:HAUS augmin-like complex subunit 8 isoform X2 [Gymnodraco acuticeps]|uniref:HAUS augmin-like complex subunit 8 isoform X2 n=1 Tax=Gymnodraco acuticeps TaxID=8218 RepID=A0A6P8US25_GYMAC|nr:HAUS augmin-like complex subunit 8 isoform X2 [Gymnodraco acuticeps]
MPVDKTGTRAVCFKNIMASRRTSTAPSSFKSSLTDTKSSKSGSNAVKVTVSGPEKKPVKTSGNVIKSRYMQSAEKSSISKSNSLTNESFAVPLRPSSPKPSGVKPRVGTPPRRSMAPQATYGHCFQPNFDISVIKERTVMENAAEPERNPETEKFIIEMQTFLLAYLTAEMESNTAKLKAAAEARILQEMEEEEALYNEVQEKKRQYLVMEKDRLAHELLDLQIAALTPVAETAKQFAKNYKSFASAVDTTRHELPVKNFYIDGDRKEFLDKSEACLKVSEKLLEQCTEGDQKDTSTSLECLRDMKTTSKDISQQLSGTFSELLEVSSLVCRHTINVHQATEEEQLGPARTLKLYCPKP